MSNNRSRNSKDYKAYDAGFTTDESLIIENQNDILLQELASKASQLHQVSIGIHSTVDSHNQLLDETQSNFNSFEAMLNNTHNRVKNLLGSQHRRLMLCTILLVLFVVFVIYNFSSSLNSSHKGEKAE